MTALLPLAAWVPILDGDDAARLLFERHYSAQANLARRLERGTLLFIGPGEKLVLASPCRKALFAWRRAIYRADKEVGIECAVFRNEGAGLSSALIREADRIADEKWPGERHFTFVDPKAINSGDLPGYCFRRAGWRRKGESGRGLILLARSPRPIPPRRP